MHCIVQAPAGWILSALIRRGVRRAFRAVLAAGSAHLPESGNPASVLLLANHTNWWDGFAAHVLTRKLLPQREAWLLQEARQWRAAPFFRAVGAIPIDVNHPLPTLRRTMTLLRKPRQVVWFFPQGRVRHPSTPIEALPGAAFLSKHALQTGALVIPIVFHYEWLVESRPTLLMTIGEPFQPGAAPSPADIAATLQSLHDRTGASLDPIDLSDFKAIYPPRLSLNKRWEWVVAAATGRLPSFRKDNAQ